MHEPVIVIDESDDGLYRQRWVFDWQGYNLILSRYFHERRQGEQWKLIAFWDPNDEGGYGDWTWLKEKDVPFDDELQGQVVLALVDKVKIGKPRDFGIRKRRK